MGVTIPLDVTYTFFGVARFLEYSLNAPDLSILVVEGVAKVRFKCQGCYEAKKFAEHWFNVSVFGEKLKFQICTNRCFDSSNWENKVKENFVYFSLTTFKTVDYFSLWLQNNFFIHYLNFKRHESFKSIFCFVAFLKISICYISFVLNSTNHLLPVLNHSPKSSCFLWSPVEYWLIPTFTKKLSIEQLLDFYAFCSREKTATNRIEINGTDYSRLLRDICTKVKSKTIGKGSSRVTIQQRITKAFKFSTIN